MLDFSGLFIFFMSRNLNFFPSFIDREVGLKELRIN